MSRTIRWGILGPGGIARSFADGMAHAPNGELVAVASTNQERAAAFAADFGNVKAYGAYAELLADKAVDAVYVSTINTKHEETVLACLQAGKAVLCEKPLGLNEKQARNMIQTAIDKKCFLMEAYWSRFLPTHRQVLKWIADGKIGEVRRFTADFSFLMAPDPDARHYDRMQGGGVLLDVGIYLIGAAFDMFGGAPATVDSTAHIGSTGVDEAFSLTLGYGDGKVADLFGSFRCPAPFDAMVYGTKGRIRMPDFWLGSSAYLLGTDGSVLDSIEDAKIGNGYQYEAIEAGRCIAAGELMSPIMPQSDSLAFAGLMDRLRSDWGLKYPGE